MCTTTHAQILLERSAGEAGGWNSLAKREAIPLSTLRAYASGGRRPGIDQAVLLRDRLGIPLDAWVLPAGDTTAVEEVA